MSTEHLAQDLGGVVRLLVPDPKPLPDLLLAAYHEARGWSACREEMLKLISTHSAEIAGALRDAERWQTIESAPRDGSKVLLCHSGYAHPYYDRDRTPRVWVDFFRADSWYNTAPSGQPTHWRPLPAPPTQDSAMQQGGGGGGE